MVHCAPGLSSTQSQFLASLYFKFKQIDFSFLLNASAGRGRQFVVDGLQNKYGIVMLAPGTMVKGIFKTENMGLTRYT